MGFNFDENGKNDEYEADANEATGEPGDQPRQIRQIRQPAPVANPGAVAVGTAEQIVAQMLGQAQPVVVQETSPAADAYMDEVDTRFDVASRYRILSKTKFFQDGSDASQIVEAEVQAFVRERLGTLFSLGNVPKARQSEFSESEVSVLRRLASLDETQLAAFTLLLDKLSTANAMVQAPPPRAVARPAPQLAPPRAVPEAASPRPVSTVEDTTPAQPLRRGPGRPPGSKTRPKTTEEKVAVDPETGQPILNSQGQPIVLHKQRRNIAPGGIPFPTSNTEMEAATLIASGKHKQVDQSGTQVDGLVTLAKNL